jgi:hypothetical protein
MLVQIAPRDTRSRNPENPIQNKTVIPRSTPAAGATLNHKWLKTRPFLVAHQTTNQDSLPESYLESEITLVENPLCQHLLGSEPFDLNYFRDSRGFGFLIQDAGCLEVSMECRERIRMI